MSLRWPWQIWRDYRQAQRQAAINAALLKLPEVSAAINKAYERHWVQMGQLMNQTPGQSLIVNLRED
jgi:hypothetical protein